MNEETKKSIIKELNDAIGGEIYDISNAYDLESDLILQRDRLQDCLSHVSDKVPTKIYSDIEKAEQSSEKIDDLKQKSAEFSKRVENFLKHTAPLRTELNKRFEEINRLETVLLYLKSYEEIEKISQEINQSHDDEEIIDLYGKLKSMCVEYKNGSRGNYVKEYTHYWHNILKEKFSKQYEEVLKLLKWPIASGAENSPPPKEILIKFNNLTRYLFSIKEPEDGTTASSELEEDLCLPVKLLLCPLKKRFTFHFTGPRQTARIDRPEWFLTQTLTWIKDHRGFIQKHVQPVADKMQLKKVKAVDEFVTGLILLAAERLHTVIGLYHSQSAKGAIVDVDAAFAHAVDETLGFHRELMTITGKEVTNVLSVLTKAETFVKWLAVEKKYALIKMDETLGNAQWIEPVAAGVGAAVGSVLWVPRGADWFISLLKTIEDRYVVLPQPGHRLQFLELQLELVEEWRIRLTQLLSASVSSLHAESFLAARATAPHLLTAVVNAAHHTRSVLLQWAHSLHYLQLHYYRRQFQHFTQQQHHEDSSASSCDETDGDGDDSKKSEMEDTMSLEEVEQRAKKLALNELSRQNSTTNTINVNRLYYTSPTASLAVAKALPLEADAEEAGVWGEAPALLAHLRDAGLTQLAHHIALEFKAATRDYKKQKWHAMLVVEEQGVCCSAALCAGLGALGARLAAATQRLAPPPAAALRAHLAQLVDDYLFEEVAMESWFNTGGTIQFTHDVKRVLIPVFTPPNKVASQSNQLPKLTEVCKLLNMDYDDARRLRSTLSKQVSTNTNLLMQGFRHLQPCEALNILNQRTDLLDPSSPSSVMELF